MCKGSSSSSSSLLHCAWGPVRRRRRYMQAMALCCCWKFSMCLESSLWMCSGSTPTLENSDLRTDGRKGGLSNRSLQSDTVYRTLRFCEMFSRKLLLQYTTSLGWMAAVVLPTSQRELARKLVSKPCGQCMIRMILCNNNKGTTKGTAEVKKPKPVTLLSAGKDLS